MNKLFIWGEIVVVVTSFPILAKAIPLFKKLLLPPMNKEKRIEMVKIILPMLVPVLAVEIVLDALNSPYAFVFSSAMFILWMCLLIPLYLSVFRKARHGVLKLLGVGIAWAIFFICLAISIDNTS
ncbi:MAG: hypothetical protein U9R23_06585 [Candidatus Cloacimonadota bacterium]|nr:hypothetical protein [Candidatus Cloacimonadota bacterium]